MIKPQLRALLPERRFNSKFIDRLNQYAQIVAQHLTQDLVRLGNGRFGADTAAKLRLDHVESGFHV